MTLAEVVEAHITKTLEECGGNITKTAKQLGLYRATLQRKLRRMRPATASSSL